MSAFAPGQTRGLVRFGPRSGSSYTKIRAVLRLGFFVFSFAGCVPESPDTVARNLDARYGTGAFSWLTSHQPASLVVWRPTARDVAGVVPGSTLADAGSAPCAQAKAAHAALLLVAGLGSLRDRAEDCGIALYHDGHALVIAPR